MSTTDIRPIAETEGWLLAWDAERVWIERIDEAGVFDSDEAAEAWVRDLAARGSAVHKVAVETVGLRHNHENT